MAGDLSQAKAALLDALRLARDIRSAPLALDALLALASLDARAGEVERAWQLAAGVARQAASRAQTRARADQLCAGLEAQLTPEQRAALAARASAAPLPAMMQTVLE